MVFLLEQTYILEELASLLHHCLGEGHGEFVCKFKYIEDFDTLGLTLYTINGAGGSRCYIEPPDGLASDSIDVAEKLRNLMGSHTGVAWTSMTLTLDAEGRATAKFHYPEGEAE